MMDIFQEQRMFNPIIGLPVFHRRPDFDLELAHLEIKYPRKNFAIFCCGPQVPSLFLFCVCFSEMYLLQVFSDEIEKAVERANARRVASFSFSPEIFSFSWV